MSSKVFDIELHDKAQLIDLNETNKNFEIDFNVTTEKGEEFSALVIDKEQLDKEKDLNSLELKKSNGSSIKGTIENNEDKDTTYFLVIKREGTEPCHAKVEIYLKEIESHEEEDVDTYALTNYTNKDMSFTSLFNKYFFHIMGFCIFLFLLYHFYTNTNISKYFSKKKTDTSSIVNPNPSIVNPNPNQNIVNPSIVNPNPNPNQNIVNPNQTIANLNPSIVSTQPLTSQVTHNYLNTLETSI
jgi:hypothetical protein